MSLGPSFDAKEQVRQAIDIVDLAGSYIQLRRQGRNFVGICPWHDDRRPSLQVNPERQSFKCWVCQVGGDVFSFLMKAEGIEFREALEMLAERAGITLQQASHHGSEVDEAAGQGNDKRTLLRLMAWAEEQFHRCLISAPEGEPGRVYFAERGITDESIRRFHLGFAPERWDWLVAQARGAQWTPSQLERVGLLVRRDTSDGFYDRFRGRVIFSIRDAQSRPIAFGGRVLPQLAGDRVAKYINSPETPLFSKSRELYGLDVARPGIARAGAIVMEGYTDCLMAQQNGIDNVVAVLGTALGERHLQVLRRYTDSVTLVLDGDDAGRRRTNEILDALLALFEKNQVDLRILTLPEGIDPCDFIATQGSDAFRQLLTTAVDALEHKFRTVTNGLDTLTDTHRASQAAEQLLASLAPIRPASSETLLREQQMLSRIARKLHLPEEQLRNRLVAMRRDAQQRQSSPRTAAAGASASSSAATSAEKVPSLSELSPLDRGLLELVLLDPSFLARVTAVIDPDVIESPAARRIFTACCRLAEEGEPLSFSRLLTAFDDPAMKNLLTQLDTECTEKGLTADRERWLRDLVETQSRRRQGADRRLELARAQQNTSEAEQLLARFCEQSRTKHLNEYERRKK